jgi:molybdopterin synthase catalytic subunit
MARIEAEALERFKVSRIAVVHRVGRLGVGETAVAVAVSSAHRAAAFDACRWVMDTLKTRLPVWKKEHFRGGEIWVEP